MYGTRSGLNSRTTYVQDLLTRVQWTSIHVHGVRRTLVAKIFVERLKMNTNSDVNRNTFYDVKGEEHECIVINFLGEYNVNAVQGS